MTRRITWFVSGAIAGVAGTRYAKNKLKATASQLTPAKVVKGAVTRVRDRGHDLAEAVRDGRQAMHAREVELRARLHGHENLDGPPRVESASDRRSA